MEISDLADDLLISVLVRLPIEVIGQLKSVSKSWNALISSQKFIESHLIQSRFVQKPNVLVPEHHRVNIVEFYFTGENLEADFVCKSKLLHCLPELLDDRFIVQIVGSSNGLLCLLLSVDNDKHDSYSFVLCNPLTKSTWDLPGNQWRSLFSDESSLYGFWFDDLNDDYKVVVLNPIREKDEVMLVFECEVYSLKSNSWSKVTSILEDSRKIWKYKKDGVLFNRALHWIILDNQNFPNGILALDLTAYKLKILQLPEVPEAKNRVKLTLLNLNGSLVLSNGGGYNNLWVMKKDSDSWSWTRITSTNSLIPLALLEDNQKRILVSYDDFKRILELSDLVSCQGGLRVRLPCHVYNARQLQFVSSLVRPYPPSVGFEKIISEDGLKNFKKFNIHVNGVSIDSQLSEHIRRKYYELCCERKSFLHERLVPGIRSEVAVRMIIEVVNIVDSVRSCRLTTSKEEIEKWGETARSLELLGMNVGFLRDRIGCLLGLAFDSEEGIEAKKYWEVKSQKAQIEDEIEDLEKKLGERKQVCKKYGEEVDTLKPKAESYELMFREKANDPW